MDEYIGAILFSYKIVIYITILQAPGSAPLPTHSNKSVWSKTAPGHCEFKSAFSNDFIKDSIFFYEFKSTS